MKLEMKLERILLLGARGHLGHALAAVLGEAGMTVLSPTSDVVDIRDLDQIRAFVADCKPDLLINTAAQAKVDIAEQDPDHAFHVNALGAQNAALAAAEVDIPVVHISSDYVFDGRQNQSYCEYHPTGLPPNLYGQSKLQGELLVRHTWARHFIVRVAALFGKSNRADFVDWVLASASPDKPLTIVNDRTITPTWTDDVARQLLLLIQTPYYGTYHATGHGPTTWFKLARTALELAGKDPAGVVPIPDKQLASPARRAPFTGLANHLLRLRGMDTMLPWREALAKYLRPSE
jgi:dTDP-4-dehydrorhamnose reductase